MARWLVLVMLVAGIGPAAVAQSRGVDPWTVSTDNLRKFFGALFTVECNTSDGPRPGRDDNVCTTVGMQAKPEAERQRIIAAYRQRGYTHAPVGPFIGPGYHGMTAAVDFRKDPSVAADALQEMWDGGLYPVCFLSPDNWTLDQMRALEPIFRSDRWQSLCRLIVPKGWEPNSARTSNAEYVEWLKWAREVFPRALVYLHLESDHYAPGNAADLEVAIDGKPNPRYIGNARAWRNVAPYLHGYLEQIEPVRVMPDADPRRKDEVRKLFQPERFREGTNGWPTTSAWGNSPLDHHLGEYCSYTKYHQNLPEAVCKAWGDWALQSGAAGVFDGATKR